MSFEYTHMFWGTWYYTLVHVYMYASSAPTVLYSVTLHTYRGKFD